MKCFKLALHISLFFCLTVCACRTEPGSASSSEEDQRDISLAVLAQMITGNAETIFFVNIPMDSISLLKQRCDNHYNIVSITMADVTYTNKPVNETIVRLKGTNEGSILGVKIIKIHRHYAEAFGTFVPGGVMVRYRLRYRDGAWHVVSVENVFAS